MTERYRVVERGIAKIRELQQLPEGLREPMRQMLQDVLGQIRELSEAERLAAAALLAEAVKGTPVSVARVERIHEDAARGSNPL